MTFAFHFIKNNEPTDKYDLCSAGFTKKINLNHRPYSFSLQLTDEGNIFTRKHQQNGSYNLSHTKWQNILMFLEP